MVFVFGIAVVVIIWYLLFLELFFIMLIPLFFKCFASRFGQKCLRNTKMKSSAVKNVQKPHSKKECCCTGYKKQGRLSPTIHIFDFVSIQREIKIHLNAFTCVTPHLRLILL